MVSFRYRLSDIADDLGIVGQISNNPLVIVSAWLQNLQNCLKIITTIILDYDLYDSNIHNYLLIMMEMVGMDY